MYLKLKEEDVKAFLSGRKGRLISACQAGKNPVVIIIYSERNHQWYDIQSIIFMYSLYTGTCYHIDIGLTS